ncbi:thermonuclease family protein [Staphylococcus pseudintermedius]
MNRETKWYQNWKSGLTLLFVLTVVAFAATCFTNLENALAATGKSTVTSSKAAQPGTTQKFPVELVKAVDGDTAKLKYQGKTETFRFLLIDTPETKHPRLGKQPFGQEASDRTAKLLKNANKIEVEFDVGRKQDKYHRYLAYIYVDGKMVNNILVKEGLAKVDYVYPPNTRYLSQLEKSQKAAKKQN